MGIYFVSSEGEGGLGVREKPRKGEEISLFFLKHLLFFVVLVEIEFFSYNFIWKTWVQAYIK